jgi:hypothetical protein
MGYQWFQSKSSLNKEQPYHGETQDHEEIKVSVEKQTIANYL